MASTRVRTANAGHCQAPRIRQRSRGHQSRSTCPGCCIPISVTAGCPTLADVTPRPVETPRRGRRESGDPGPCTTAKREKRRQMATETAQSAVPADVSEHLTTEDRVGLLRAMLMMRGIEERTMTLYRQGKVPGSFYD